MIATKPDVFETMGTVVSLTAPGLTEPTAAAVREVFRAYDERFSLYRGDSELSRINRREVLLTRASAEARAAYAAAEEWRAETDGAFTPHRPDGALDLSGIVKALAIRDAGEALDAAGLTDWCLNAGGDVLARGRDTDRDGAWTIGLVDPFDRSRLFSQFACDDTLRAVATSGTAERGEHIWRLDDQHSFAQVTVAAPDIVTADVLATALLSGGVAAIPHLLGGRGLEVLAVTKAGEYYSTAAFDPR